MMRILLTRISNDRHVLEVVRGDGSGERVELETKSLLTHDLLHYAVESLAGTQGGFWGALASGKALREMNDRSGMANKEYLGTLTVIEPIVGAMTGAIAGKVPPEAILVGIQNLFEASKLTVPSWLTKELIVGVQARMRELLGRWNATPFGETMELEWRN